MSTSYVLSSVNFALYGAPYSHEDEVQRGGDGEVQKEGDGDGGGGDRGKTPLAGEGYKKLLQLKNLVQGVRLSRVICDAIACDNNVCDVVCDQVCDTVCDTICDGICDTICDQVCDCVCDAVCDLNALCDQDACEAVI